MVLTLLFAVVPEVARGSFEQGLGEPLFVLDLFDVFFAFLVNDQLAAAQFLLAAEHCLLKVAVVSIS